MADRSAEVLGRTVEGIEDIKISYRGQIHVDRLLYIVEQYRNKIKIVDSIDRRFLNGYHTLTQVSPSRLSHNFHTAHPHRFLNLLESCDLSRVTLPQNQFVDNLYCYACHMEMLFPRLKAGDA